MAMQEGGNSLHHANFPLLGHPQRKGWCPSLPSPCPPLCWVGLEKLASILFPLVSLTRVSAASRPAWPRSALGNPVPWSTSALGCRRKSCFTVCARNRYLCPAGVAQELLCRCGAVATSNKVHGGGRQRCPARKAKSEGVGWAQASSRSGNSFSSGKLPSLAQVMGERQGPAPASGCVWAGCQSLLPLHPRGGEGVCFQER